jgi:uncharacterized protein
MPALRVVLDTNVLVSGLAYPRGIPGRILEVWRLGGVQLVLSRYILDEVVRVLPRLTKERLTSSQIRALADTFLFFVEIVEPAGKPEKDLRDIADEAVLGTLLAADADYLITGDKDLLALADRYPIVTPASFWEKHGR